MTVGELEQRLSSTEEIEWRLLARHEPFGDDRLEFLFARLMALHINLNTTKQSDKKQPSDLIYDYWPRPQADPADMLRKLVRFVQVNKGTVPSEVLARVNDNGNV